MANLKHSLNNSLLPDDVLSYTDTKFYNVAKQFLGDSATELLEIQSIRSPSSFLFMPDVFAIFNIKCAALNPLKEKLCLKTDDNKYIVKPGIKSTMSYFRQLITSKQAELMKISSYENKQSTLTISPLNITASTTNGNSDNQQQHSSLSATTDLVQPLSTIPVDENYHRNFILNSIKNWCEKYFSKFSLTDGIHYQLIFTSLNDANVTAKIKCKCGISIGLVKLRKNFQISNFYKHLVSVPCDVIKKTKKTSISNNDKNKNKNKNNLTDNIDESSQKENGRKRSASPNVAKKQCSHQNHQK